MNSEAEANVPTRDLERVVERAVERALRLEYWYRWARFAFWPIAILAAFWAIYAAVVEMGIVGWLFALGGIVALIVIGYAIRVAYHRAVSGDRRTR